MGVARPVYIVVLNWNGWSDTIACLDSLRAVTTPAVKVLVVDNASTNESVQKLQEYIASGRGPKEIKLLENNINAGFSGGMNMGIEAARAGAAEWIVLLNNDTLVDPHFVEIMLAAAEADSTIGMVNPKILLLEKRNVIWSVGGRINWMKTKGWHIGYNERDQGQYDSPAVQDSAYTTGGCVLLRASMLLEIGLMPEAYFLYYEDVEWSLLAQRAGWRTVVVPKAKIWHKGAASTREFSEAYIRYHVRNGLLLARRMGSPAQIVVAYGVSILRAVYQLLKWVGVPNKRPWARAILQGIMDAWMNRTGFIKQSYE